MGTFLGSALTVALAMLLAGTFAVLVKNASLALDKLKSEPTVEVYIRDAADSSTQSQLSDFLSASRFVARADYISKDMALFRLREMFGREMIAGLKTNPLPASFEITLAPSAYENDNFEMLVDSLKALPAVEDVGYVASVMPKLRAILRITSVLGIVASVMVLLATGFIAGNAVHLMVARRHQALHVMRLVGASGAFVRTPYLLIGGLVAIIGTAAAIAALGAATVIFNAFVIRIGFLSLSEVAGLVLVGLTIGIAGSYLALRKHLRI